MASTKTAAELVKHLPEPLFRVLQWHRQISKHTKDSAFVFCKFDGSTCDPNFARDSELYPAMDRAEIERGPRTHGFHIFRHSAGSIIHKKTGSMKLAQIQLGHADMGTTANIYVHTDEEQLKYAAEVLAEAISPSFCPPICRQILSPIPKARRRVALESSAVRMAQVAPVKIPHIPQLKFPWLLLEPRGQLPLRASSQS